MKKARSAADPVPQDLGTPLVDSAPPGTSPGSVTTPRRTNAAPRSNRTRKITQSDAPPVQNPVQIVEHLEVSPIYEKPKRSTGRGTAVKKVDASVETASQNRPAPKDPPAEIPTLALQPAAASPRSRRAGRKRGATKQTAPQAAVTTAADAAPLELATDAESPARIQRSRRPSRQKDDKKQPGVTPTFEAVSGSTEKTVAAAVTIPSSRSRRGGRRQRRTIAEPEQAAIEAPVTPVVPPSAMRRRGGRRPRGAESPVEAFVQPSAAPAATGPAGAEPRPRRAPRRPPEPPEDLRVGARVLTRRGQVELHINGEVRTPVFFFGNVEGEKEARRVASEIRGAASNGVHLHSTLIEVPCPLPPDDELFETLDSRLSAVLAADTTGYVMPRLVFVPAPGWMRQYPHEVTHYADGKSADPSIASNRFWTDAEHALALVIEHIQRTNIGDRVMGYHLERGEWFNPAENGFDRSLANREAFREWLRTKYKNSAVSLRAAWYDGDVQFHTAEIPTLPDVQRSDRTFYEPRKERRWIDFVEYTSDITADRLISLSKVVKQSTRNRALVSVCYGYTFEFHHTFSGHLALGRILNAPTVDLICGPPSYRDRRPGQAGSLPSPVDSMPLHGKLWISEDDTKTHLAPAEPSPDDFNPRLDNHHDTEQVHLRAMGASLAHQSGIEWMDLWGEGWLDGPDVWDGIGQFVGRYDQFIKGRKVQSPEVVVLIDERSLFHVQRGPQFLKRLLEDQREAIARCGASVGYYLQSDVTSKAFPTDAKVYLFLNPYRLPAEQKLAIRDKLHTNGKTLVWMYAIGVCDERGEPEEGAHEVIGIALRPQSWSSETGSRIVDTRHAITDRLPTRDLGLRERLNPSYYVEDDEPGLTVLAEYQQSGLPSVALRQMSGWTSLFCGEPTLNADLLRGICRHAGVHLYTSYPDDYVTAGHGWVTTHSIRDGNRTFLVPPRCALYDVIEGRLIGEDLSEHRSFVKGRTTRIFYAGSPDEMRKIGFTGVERRRTRRGVKPSELGAPEPVAVTRMEPPELIETEDEPVEFEVPFPIADEKPSTEFVKVAALFEVDDSPEPAEQELVVPFAPATDAELDGAEPGSQDGSETVEQVQHRRRRRGGRGRGRRSRNGNLAPAITPPSH